MKIDNIYINEAIRIREEYINNMHHINNSDTIIKNIIKDMEKLKDDISTDSDISEDVYKSKLVELDTILNKISVKIVPYHEKIMLLGKDQEKLSLAIKDKYPKISDDDIQQQIIPHIIELDEKLKKMM